jgi:hypothetical protein
LAWRQGRFDDGAHHDHSRRQPSHARIVLLCHHCLSRASNAGVKAWAKAIEARERFSPSAPRGEFAVALLNGNDREPAQKGSTLLSWPIGSLRFRGGGRSDARWRALSACAPRRVWRSTLRTGARCTVSPSANFRPFGICRQFLMLSALAALEERFRRSRDGNG